jgi:formate dehydrogenase maturation protein FdhE
MSSVSEQVGKVGDKLKNGVAQAQAQVQAKISDLEKQVEDRVAKLEKQAKASLDDVAPQFQRIQRAWEGLLAKLRSALAIATKRELEDLASKVEELAAKVDRLLGIDAAAPVTVTEAAPAAEGESAQAAAEGESTEAAEAAEGESKSSSKKPQKKNGRR